MEHLSQTNIVKLSWVKVHSNNTDNFIADNLAKQASKLTIQGPTPLIPIPFSEYKTWLHDHTNKTVDTTWKANTDCRQSKEAFPKPNKHLTNKLTRLDRPKLKTVVELITGHCHLNKHLFNIGYTDSALCRACLRADKTSAHILD